MKSQLKKAPRRVSSCTKPFPPRTLRRRRLELDARELRDSAADNNAGHIALSGWLTLDSAKKLIAAGGHNFDTLKKAAMTREFRPVPLGARASFTIENTLRTLNRATWSRCCR
jgi:hypothetical protein